MLLQPSHEHVFPFVSPFSERAAQERDPGKASWRTCTRTSRPLNVPLLRLAHTLPSRQRDTAGLSVMHQISLLFCINIGADVLDLAFLLPS